MNVTSVSRGRATTTVTVEYVEAGTEDLAILGVALTAARETLSSLFGWGVTRFDGGIVQVELHTD